VRGRGRGHRKRGEMPQTMHTHRNKLIKNFKSKKKNPKYIGNPINSIGKKQKQITLFKLGKGHE
jgi:hypothetical protein